MTSSATTRRTKKMSTVSLSVKKNSKMGASILREPTLPCDNPFVDYVFPDPPAFPSNGDIFLCRENELVWLGSSVPAARKIGFWHEFRIFRAFLINRMERITNVAE
jgi:hypothetical protein